MNEERGERLDAEAALSPDCDSGRWIAVTDDGEDFNDAILSTPIDKLMGRALHPLFFRDPQTAVRNSVRADPRLGDDGARAVKKRLFADVLQGRRQQYKVAVGSVAPVRLQAIAEYPV